MRLAFVIPTFNEAGNIKELINGIKSACRKAGHSCSIIIVDDNSPDKTGLIAKRLGVKVLVRRNKRGLGSAYKDGIKLVPKSADLIFFMDADLSHDPSQIPDFVKAFKGVDVVQGSRKVEGGRIEGWGFKRYLISYVSSLITWPLTSVKDPNGSFKCFKRSLLGKIDFDSLSDGYGFLIELIYVFNKMGLKIKEIPIVFRQRGYGESKITFKEILRSLRLYLSLYYRSIFKKWSGKRD